MDYSFISHATHTHIRARVHTHAQAPLMSTLLFSSDRTHLASSTTLSYPVASSCTYFGCYGANRGYNFYTFQEVSCTATAISSTAGEVYIQIV